MFGPICRRKFTALEEVDDDITLDEQGWGTRPRNRSARCAGVDPAATSPLRPLLALPPFLRLSWSIDSLKVNKIHPFVACGARPGSLV